MKQLFYTTLILFQFLGYQYTQAQVTNGLIAHYPFDGNADDIISTINGTVNNATLTTDRWGNPNSAYHFVNGSTNSFIGLGDNFNSVIVGNNKQFSISLWFKKDFINQGMTFISKVGSNWCNENKHQLDFSIQNSGLISFNYYDASSGVLASVAATYERPDTLVTDTAWHHLVATYDGTISSGQKRVVFYLDNQILSSQISNNGLFTPYITTNNAHMGIGHSLNSQGVPCGSDTYGTDGKIDDIRIYNRVLNPTEVDSLCPSQLTAIFSPQLTQNSIQVYPNPVEKNLNIKIDYNITTASLIKIINPQGQILASYNNINDSFLLDFESFSQGIYFVQLWDGKALIGTQKILKQ